MDEEKEVWNNKNGKWLATNKALKPNMKYGDTITDYKTCVRSFTNNNGSNCIDEDK